MLNFKTLIKALYPDNRYFPGARIAASEELTPESATMGTLFIGRQGTGKTTSLARHLVEQFKRFPETAIFVLDASGSISDSILALLAQEPKLSRERLLSRVVYDEMGHPEWVIPLPEFSSQYGTTYEEQVQRVAQNLSRLDPELVQRDPFVGGLALKETFPQVARLLTAIGDRQGFTWQVTEAKRLMADADLMNRAVKKYGYRVPEAKWHLEQKFIPLQPRERELRTFAITALLGAIETREGRARVGLAKPGWTPKEAINSGLMVLVNGARLINQKTAQNYLFTQAYSLIMAEINKRTPANPKDKPVTLVMDEVYSLLSIPGMASEIGTLAPLYRSRKVELYIVLQALSQLDKTLREQIYSIGNIVCFAVSNFDEAYELAQQIFKYYPDTVKLTPKTDTQQPVLNSDREQYLLIANDIQRMRHRECILRRYLTEQRLDNHVVWVPETKSLSSKVAEVGVAEIKERLLMSRGVRVKDALEVVNKRRLDREPPKGSEPPERPAL